MGNPELFLGDFPAMFDDQSLLAMVHWFIDHIISGYPLVMTNIAIENDHRNSGFSH